MFSDILLLLIVDRKIHGLPVLHIYPPVKKNVYNLLF